MIGPKFFGPVQISPNHLRQIDLDDETSGELLAACFGIRIHLNQVDLAEFQMHQSQMHFPSSQPKQSNSSSPCWTMIGLHHTIAQPGYISLEKGGTFTYRVVKCGQTSTFIEIRFIYSPPLSLSLK